MEPLFQLFESYTGARPTQYKVLSGSGSNRTYCRLWLEDKSYMGVRGTVLKENHAFLTLARKMKAEGLLVPEVLAVSKDELYYIQEDLGDDSLFFNHIATGFTEETLALLHKTIAALPSLQFKTAQNFDFSICYPVAAFDQRSILWDLNYFKYEFLKPSGVEFDEALLEDEFERLCQDLLQDPTNTFMYRDFQSRNVMIVQGEPYFIDFQGGRKGPIYYDLVSFIYQAKAQIPAAIKKDLIATYLQALQPFYQVDQKIFMEKVNLFALFRTLQVLGAYGFRGLIEQKAHFIASIPFAIANLQELITENDYQRYPYLLEVLQDLIACYPVEKTPVDPTRLCVDVYSFSYKKGIPTDYSGNGGGFVFDCRSLHNPGRYEEYKQSTGRDQNVIDFLEKNGEILTFLDHIYEIADQAVARYVQRGFTHLQFSFGCTGGQHRSVYGAQHLAEHIAQKFGVQVRLIHRERKITEYFNCPQ